MNLGFFNTLGIRVFHPPCRCLRTHFPLVGHLHPATPIQMRPHLVSALLSRYSKKCACYAHCGSPAKVSPSTHVASDPLYLRAELMNSEHAYLLPLCWTLLLLSAVSFPVVLREVREACDPRTTVIGNWGLQVIFKLHCSHMLSDFFPAFFCPTARTA